eukprot:1620814-Alexandrium_andersonii.AAC.1
MNRRESCGDASGSSGGPTAGAIEKAGGSHGVARDAGLCGVGATGWAAGGSSMRCVAHDCRQSAPRQIPESAREARPS